jgi:EmrB/QacA subfamily drug resistance transporter
MSTSATLSSGAQTDRRARKSRPAAILAVILAAQLMMAVDITIVTIALPNVQADLHFSPTDLSWVQNAYLLAFGGLLLLGGRVGDLFGRRRVFVAGVLVFTVASLLAGLSGSASWLLAARALQGVGAALAGPSTLALIATNFAEGPARNRALAWFSSLTGAGSSVGLILGGVLTSAASWPWVFFVNLPIGITVAVLAPRLIAQPERRAGRIDVLGALVGTAGMLSLVYGFIRAAGVGWGDRLTLLSFAGAVVLLVLFVILQTRVAQPIMPLRLFADRNRSAAFVTMLLLVAGMFGMFFLLTQFLQDVLGYGPVTAGVAFLPLTLGVFTMAQTVPTLVARFGQRRVMITGAVLMTAGMAWLTGVSASTSYAGGLLVPMLLFGVGIGCCSIPLTMIVLSSVPPEESGIVAGLQQTMQYAGGALGLAVLVSVFGTAGRGGGADPRQVLADGIGSALVAALIFTGCALLVVLFAIKPGRVVPERPRV